jgi:YHS domain-containing protein
MTMAHSPDSVPAFYRWLVLCAALLLAACGSPHATTKNVTGQNVMLLGHDPVAYFTKQQSLRGNPVFQSTLPGRTYYFVSAQHKSLFDAAPEKYEPQYAGFCATGAAYGLKLGSDPSEWRIEGGKLYIFGDILGRTAWALDPARYILQGEKMWVEAKDAGWRGQTLKRLALRVSWYKSDADMRKEFEAKNPGVFMPVFDTGGLWQNLFVKDPGWRAREGYGGQAKVGLVGDDPCPVACIGLASQPFAPK